MIAGASLPMLLGILAAAGLRVETGTPDALCPDPESVRRAVHARVGDVEGQGAAEWLATYTIVHRPDTGGDVVRLELFDPTRRSRLRRDLPSSDESCQSVAQAIAVVLDLYFRRPAAPADADADTAADARAAAPAATARAAPVAGGGARGTAPAVGIFGGLGGQPGSPAVGVDVGLRFGSGWDVGVQGAWLTARQEEAVDGTPDGRVALRSVALRAYAGPRLSPHPAIDVTVGPELLLGLDIGSASNLSNEDPGMRAVPGVGLRAAADLALAAWLAVSLAASVDYAPPAWTRAFAVGDVEVLRPAALRLLLSAGFHFRFGG
jgi:hypothetical protein